MTILVCIWDAVLHVYVCICKFGPIEWYTCLWPPRLCILTHVLGLLTLLAGGRHFQMRCRPLTDRSHLDLWCVILWLPLFPSNHPLSYTSVLQDIV